jgi:hypothetical protein
MKFVLIGYLELIKEGESNRKRKKMREKEGYIERDKWRERESERVRE